MIQTIPNQHTSQNWHSSISGERHYCIEQRYCNEQRWHLLVMLVVSLMLVVPCRCFKMSLLVAHFVAVSHIAASHSVAAPPFHWAATHAQLSLTTFSDNFLSDDVLSATEAGGLCSGIAYVFGNAVLTFNCHHSVPGLVTPVRPQAYLKHVFRSVLTFCCTGLAALCILAMLAFHNAKGSDCDTHDGPPCEINKLYNLNFSSYHIPLFAKLLDG